MHGYVTRRVTGFDRRRGHIAARQSCRLAGDDPRIALRERLPDNAKLEAIVARLAKINAACPTPWTKQYLRLIADQTGIVSRVLAPQVDADVPPFKRSVASDN